MTWIVADAYISARTFPQHDRDVAHYGFEYDEDVILSATIGPWPTGTPLDVVLAGMYQTFSTLSLTPNTFAVFTADAYVAWSYTANAVITKAMPTATFTADAAWGQGWSLTVDAWLYRAFALTADAVVVENVC